MQVQETFRGSATATGVVPMVSEADYSGGKRAFTAWLGTDGYDRFTLVTSAGVGTTALEGCNGDPDVAAEWYSLGTITDDGELAVVDQAVRFIRVNVTAYTSGTLDPVLTVES